MTEVLLDWADYECLNVVVFLAVQRNDWVCAAVWEAVQLAGQREEAEGSPLVHQLPQQMEPTRLLSATVKTAFLIISLFMQFLF